MPNWIIWGVWVILSQLVVGIDIFWWSSGFVAQIRGMIKRVIKIFGIIPSLTIPFQILDVGVLGFRPLKIQNLDRIIKPGICCVCGCGGERVSWCGNCGCPTPPHGRWQHNMPPMRRGGGGGGGGGVMLGDWGRGGFTLPVSRDGDAGISSESESPRLGVSDSEEMTITSSDADYSEFASEIMIALSESAIFERNRKRLLKGKEIKIKLRLNETRNHSERKVLKNIEKVLY